MLSTFYAAETQFRLESDVLDRELARVALQRERADERSAHRVARRARRAVRRAAGWPRPIGVAHPQPACP